GGVAARAAADVHRLRLGGSTGALRPARRLHPHRQVTGGNEPVKKAVAVISLLGLAPALAGAAEEAVNVVPNNFGLQIWVVATFLVMFLLLAKLAFKPIAEALDRRGQAIKQAIEDAEKTRGEAKRLMEDYQKQ